MCGSTVDIQFATAEIRRGKKKEESLIILSIFLTRLISAVADWMSTILPHMYVWP